MGPFPIAVRQLKFLVVDIDYFTKWVEVDTLTTITEKNVRNFVWRNIIYRTTIRMPTRETPFRLAYESKEVIPAEVKLTSYKVENHDESRNDEAMHLQLDLVDKVRGTTEQRLAWYQDLMAKHYSSKVKNRDFQVGDLVLRKVTGAMRNPAEGKLGLNWERPYRITSWQKRGTYHLEMLKG
ncbi:uncharacterized protein LOC142635249 [Castanea sativa]|uniref:uncharacterized protein LOC142635249 n=1 Tax=Castanea sativa TaxID=21020 RepID=UPI003F64DD7F